MDSTLLAMDVLSEYYIKQSDGTMKININHRSNNNKIKVKRDILIWLYYLDEIQFNGINSSTIGTLGLTSTLGFFNVAKRWFCERKRIIFHI